MAADEQLATVEEISFLRDHLLQYPHIAFPVPRRGQVVTMRDIITWYENEIDPQLVTSAEADDMGFADLADVVSTNARFAYDHLLQYQSQPERQIDAIHVLRAAVEANPVDETDEVAWETVVLGNIVTAYELELIYQRRIQQEGV